VVAPAAGGPLDLVEDGVTGYLVRPADPDAFTTSVARLAADPGMRAAFGAAGRQKVFGRSWPALTDELVGHYTAVLGCPQQANAKSRTKPSKVQI
jgi:phosphatidylinositol alpha 1,6-mannosyltransferase